MAATVTKAMGFKRSQPLALNRTELEPLPSPDSIWKIAVGVHLTRVDGGTRPEFPVEIMLGDL